MPDINKIPFVRLMIPFSIGVIAGLYYGKENVTLYVLSFAATLFLVSVFLVKQKLIFQLIMELIFLIIGYSTSQWNIERQNDYLSHIPFEKSGIRCIAEVSDIPVQKNSNVKVVMTVKAIKTDLEFTSNQFKMLVYFKNAKREYFMPGQTLLMDISIREIRNYANPLAFNYKDYMYDRGVYCMGFAEQGNYVALNEPGVLNLSNAGLNAKYRIIQKLRNSGLSNEAFSISSALLTGYDDEIDESVRDGFSHSGAMHVLSISGLHVGIIYLILTTAFSILVRNRKLRYVELTIVLIVLWFFAFMTGFHPPVLRAVIMFSIIGIGRSFVNKRYVNQVNLLMFTAFIMLLFDPFLIRNIGFLLSFSAVLGIYILYKPIYACVNVPNRVLNYAWKSMCVSISATLFTLPITLFVFHQFPLWFMISNLFIVPIATSVMILSLFILVGLSPIYGVCNFLTIILLKFIGLFDSPGYSYIENIDFGRTDMIFMYVAFILIGIIYHIRKFRPVLSLFALVITWQVLNITKLLEVKNKQEILVFRSGKNDPVVVKNADQLYIDIDSMNKQIRDIKPYIISCNYPELKVRPFNYLRYKGDFVYCMEQKQALPDSLMEKVTCLIVSNNVKPGLLKSKPVSMKQLVVRGSNSNATIDEWKVFAGKNNLPIHITKYQGAFQTAF